MTNQRDWGKRLHCLLHGHDLLPADAYGEQLPDGTIVELHYCRHCGIGVWKPGHAHAGVFPEPDTAHQLPDMVSPMAPPGSHQHISP
ncbi:MAG TPA: hypothetical protein VHV55_02675 [Pirellulales bacterium]|jgi:hypothetical protein|nr:hypothetical protein [Pirellulales bacterium]